MTWMDTGMPAAPGTLTLVRVGERLRVERADPRIWVSLELLVHLTRGASAEGHHPDVTYADGVLRIDAVNQRVVYRQGEWVAAPDCWVFEWPD